MTGKEVFLTSAEMKALVFACEACARLGATPPSSRGSGKSLRSARQKCLDTLGKIREEDWKNRLEAVVLGSGKKCGVAPDV